MTKKKAVKKVKKAAKKPVKKTKPASKGFSINVFQAKMTVLEKELARNQGKEAMEDEMEDKVDALEEELKDMVKEGKISKEKATVLFAELERLEEMAD